MRPSPTKRIQKEERELKYVLWFLTFFLRLKWRWPKADHQEGFENTYIMEDNADILNNKALRHH